MAPTLTRELEDPEGSEPEPFASPAPDVASVFGSGGVVGVAEAGDTAATCVRVVITLIQVEAYAVAVGEDITVIRLPLINVEVTVVDDPSTGSQTVLVLVLHAPPDSPQLVETSTRVRTDGATGISTKVVIVSAGTEIVAVCQSVRVDVVVQVIVVVVITAMVLSS